MKFDQFTQRNDVLTTDQLVGYRTDAAGGEGRWTAAVVLAWIQSQRVVAFPATPTSVGTLGDVAYSNGFAALCTATNTWVFWATSSDYPF